MKTLPSGRSAVWTDTIGRETTADHIPMTAGFSGFGLLNVTETGADKAA
jgi:hypothetical protein